MLKICFDRLLNERVFVCFLLEVLCGWFLGLLLVFLKEGVNGFLFVFEVENLGLFVLKLGL